MICCNYGENLDLVVCDLVSAPMSNLYLSPAELDKPELYFPLCVYICTGCWLMQIEDYQRSQEIFGEDCRYYSSYSSSWVDHAEEFVAMIIPRLKLTNSSHVMEIASSFLKSGIFPVLVWILRWVRQ